jgi:hypothetical protein
LFEEIMMDIMKLFIQGAEYPGERSAGGFGKTEEIFLCTKAGVGLFVDRGKRRSAANGVWDLANDSGGPWVE